MVTPPPTTDPGIAFPVCPGRGRKTNTPKFLEFPKTQKPKKTNPSFGFLETRAGASKSKNRAKSSSFQNSKNPKIPTQVSDFWKLEREPQNPKTEQIPRLSKIPKIQKFQPKFRIFGNSSGSLKIQKSSKFLEFPKFQKIPTQVSDFWKLERERQNPKIEQIPRVSKIPKIQKIPTQVSDFWKLERERQNAKIEQIPRVSKIPNLGVIFLEFWKLEEFARFLDLEAPARVSKIPKIQKFQPKFRIFGNSSGSVKIQKSSKFLEFPKFQTLGCFFFDFWNFGNSRNLLDFWIWRLPLEFPKFQKPKNSNPSLGFLETRTGASKSKNRANSSSFQNSKPWGVVFGFLEFWKLEEFARLLDFEAPVRVSKNPNLWGGFLDFWNFGNWSLDKIFSEVLI